MPILEALPLAVDVIRSQAIKQRFSQIKPRIERGASFARAVGELSFVGRAQAYATILAGEASGALPEMLVGYSEGETTVLNRFDDLVAEWTPRLVYTLAALWMGYGILRSGAFMPSLPPDLRQGGSTSDFCARAALAPDQYHHDSVEADLPDFRRAVRKRG